MTTTDSTTTAPAKRPSSRDRARTADAAKLQSGLPGSKPLTTAQRNRALAVVPPAGSKGTPSAPAAPAKGKSTSASKPAAKPAPKAPAKPKIDATAVVHSAMVRVLADLAVAWDASTGVSAADAMKLISHRAGYMSPKATWDSRLLPRHIHNGH